MKALKEQDRLVLDSLYDQLRRQRETYVGYPNSQLLANEGLARFLDLTINNVGDPFHGNNGMNTCALECEVVDFFRELLHLESENFWGYVTNGGTEGNLHGLFLGRETLPDGVIYYSRASHYSVPKAARLLGGCSALVDATADGEIDYNHLHAVLRAFRHRPAIINANIGTTMTGAIDKVEKILEILADVGIRRYHIHCDAALFGAMLPFVPEAPKFDFQLPISSMAISGHKFLGSPIPCGLALTRRNSIQKIEASVEYIGSLDSTISGSRDGFSVLILWQAIRRLGHEGLAEQVSHCLELSTYAETALDEIGWPHWRTPCSNIVVIERPPDSLVRKWQLATEGEISHIILMPGIQRGQIDRLAEDLAATGKQRRVR